MKPRQRQQLTELLEELKALKERIPEGPATFMREKLGFQPTAYQLDLIQKFQASQFVAARWARQTGKSHIKTTAPYAS